MEDGVDKPQKLILDVDSPLLADIHNLIVDVVNRLDKLVLGTKGGGGGKAAPGGGDPKAGGLSGAMGMVSKFAGAVASAAAAVLAFVALPPLMTAAAVPFVRALNPGLIEQFEQSLQNLQATIGYALEPIISHAVQSIREWSGMLMPTVRALRPIIDEIAGAVSGVLLTVLSLVAMNLKYLLMVVKPIIFTFTTLLKVIADIVDVTMVFVGVVMSMVEAFLASAGIAFDVADIFKTLRTTINHCITGLVMFGVAVLNLLGAVKMVANFRAAIDKRLTEKKAPAGGLVAAPRDVSTGGIEDIAKKMGERAFAAQGGAMAKSDTELLKDILTTLDSAANISLSDIIRSAVKAGMREAREAVADAIPGRDLAKKIGGLVPDASAGSPVDALESGITWFAGVKPGG